MTREVNYGNLVSFRLTDEERRRLDSNCRKAGLTRSEYLRCLLEIPVEAEGGGGSERCLVFDRKAMADLARELVKQGHHYNQGVYALNSIAFAMRHGKLDKDWMRRKLETCEAQLSVVEDGRIDMAERLEELSGMRVLRRP